MGVEIQDVGVDHAIEDDGGVEIFQILELLQQRPHDVLIHHRAKSEDVADGNGVDDGLHVREEAVNSAHREPGFGGNAPGGNVLERHLGEQRAGRVENACYGAKAAVLGGLAAIRRD